MLRIGIEVKSISEGKDWELLFDDSVSVWDDKLVLAMGNAGHTTL
jgi:hypothetical protein